MSVTKSAELVVIGPSPLKLIATLGLGGLGMTAGSAMLVSGLFGRQFLLSAGWIFVAFVGVSAACALVVSLLRSRPRIEIGPVGFTVHALVGGHSRSWSEIEGDFVVVKSGFSNAVGYRLTPACKESIKFKPTTLFQGNDEALSGAYAVPIQQLASILNEYKARA